MTWYEWFGVGIGTGVVGMLGVASGAAIYATRHPKVIVRYMMGRNRKAALKRVA